MFQNPVLDLWALGCHRRLKSIVSRLRGDPDEDRQKATSSCFSHKSTHTGLCMDMGPYRDSTGSCRDSMMGSYAIIQGYTRVIQEKLEATIWLRV